MNGRTALGAALVVLAVLAGALFLDRSQRLVPVYAAARDLPAGTSLQDGDLVVIRARLPATALRHYLRPSIDRQVSGRVLTAPVRRETLIPAELVLASSRDGDLVELPVQVDPGTWLRACGPATASRCWRPTPRAPAAVGRSSFCRPPRSSRSSRTRPGSPARAGSRRPAPHAERPCPDRGRRHRHRADLRGQDPRFRQRRWRRRAADAGWRRRPGARDRRLAAGHPADGRLRAGRLGPGVSGPGVSGPDASGPDASQPDTSTPGPGAPDPGGSLPGGGQPTPTSSSDAGDTPLIATRPPTRSMR